MMLGISFLDLGPSQRDEAVVNSSREEGSSASKDLRVLSGERASRNPWILSMLRRQNLSKHDLIITAETHFYSFPRPYRRR